MLCCSQSMIHACLRHQRYDVPLTWKLHFCNVTCTFTQFHSPSCRVSFIYLHWIWCSVFCVLCYANVFETVKLCCFQPSISECRRISFSLQFLIKTLALVLESWYSGSSVTSLRNSVEDKERIRPCTAQVGISCLQCFDTVGFGWQEGHSTYTNMYNLSPKVYLDWVEETQLRRAETGSVEIYS